MKVHRILTVLVLLGAVIGAAVVHAERDPTAWSPIVYPLQRLPLAFSHRVHLAKGVSCTTCHAAATTSQSAVDNLLPTELECRGCHPIDRNEPDKVVPGAPVAKCTACHPGYQPGGAVARTYLTPPPLKFDHSKHKTTACATCHGDMTKVDLATTQHLPTMSSCLSCHRDGAQPRRCTDCHLGNAAGRMQTQFTHGELVPYSSGLGDAHGPSFKKDHRQEASQVGATCTACHDRSECVACHQGVVKPMEFHPGNYLLAHGVEARRGTPDCSTCHRAQSFCVACHERSGISMGRVPSEFSSTEPGRAFHPANWASRTGGMNRHAGEARKNLTACASCHREEDCLDCHSNEQGKLRASPHGPNWTGSARCRALDRGNRRMCLRCHITQEELGCDWRAP
ncbi:MAG: cytochrome c3 family protein [Kofleriaceae bacterium]|nr:cytochrome c3 family protein [Kofleriaceae bacterium]